MDMLSPAAPGADAATPATGPLFAGRSVTFRLWAPSLKRAELLISGRKAVPMRRGSDGMLTAVLGDVAPGTRYCFRAAGKTFPDPASRQQEADASGWSVLRAPLPPVTTPIRPWHEAVICEVHVGTATPEGTFDALAGRLEHFRDAGYTCLELLPVNEFPGARNWGYDGTLLFAPETAYGSPESLRALIDRAHALGLSMLLDVVYNHFGDTDNFVPSYAPEMFNPEVSTPWGAGIAFNREEVREFFLDNARMWLGEYGFDGLRLDAVHEIKGEGSRAFLEQLAGVAEAVRPGAHLIVENADNSFFWLERRIDNSRQRFAAQWNDDICHVLAFLITAEHGNTGYGDPGRDAFADLEKALADGFFRDPTEGAHSDGRTRGGHAARLPPDSFISFIENHDQLGNRADGIRLCERISPDRLDFANFVIMLAPQIPLFMMGNEGNLTSGFPYFCDLPDEPARVKSEGRYTQMRESFGQDVEAGGLPEPNAPETFMLAKLPWQDYEDLPERRAALDRFRTLTAWRREKLWPLSATPCLDARTARQGNALIVTWQFEAGTLSMALNPGESEALLDCHVGPGAVSTGAVGIDGGVLRLGPFAAVVW